MSGYAIVCQDTSSYVRMCSAVAASAAASECCELVLQACATAASECGGERMLHAGAASVCGGGWRRLRVSAAASGCCMSAAASGCATETTQWRDPRSGRERGACPLGRQEKAKLQHGESAAQVCSTVEGRVEQGWSRWYMCRADQSTDVKDAQTAKNSRESLSLLGLVLYTCNLRT
jgi:hypothetical protein